MRPPLLLLFPLWLLRGPRRGGCSPVSGRQTGNGCGHSVLTPYSGTLTSKNYPDTYPNFTSCQWNIQGPMGRQLSLAFGDTDIEGSEQCKSGFLLLTSSSDGSSFGPYCGNSKPSQVVLVTNSTSVAILFNSTTHRSGRGFLLSYASGNQADLISCLKKGIHYDKDLIKAYCPAGCKGVTGDIWGNMNQGYRDTSVLCKAAVHAGVILDEQGGEITVSQQKGITLYESAYANGLHSKSGSLSEKRLIFHKALCDGAGRIYHEPVCHSLIYHYTEGRPSHICRLMLTTESGYQLLLSKHGQACVGAACSETLDIVRFNASSCWHEQNAMGHNKVWAAKQAALVADGASWAAQSSADEWLDADLGGRRNVTGIITKGSPQHNYYVKSYQILSSRDGKNWKVYKSSGAIEDKVFAGNSNSHQAVYNAFIPPILARYLRVVPQDWNQRIALKVALLGCPPARLKALRPYSDSGIHSGPIEVPGLTSSPATFITVPGIAINSSKTGPPLLVMLLIGGFVLLSSALLLLVFLCHKKSRKTAIEQDCGLIKGYPALEASHVHSRESFHLATTEITSFPGAETTVDHSIAQSPEYAEPDMVQVTPSSQTAPSTFKPALEEGYTLPLVVSHYDVPGKYHEYAQPLPPEPEYATPFVDQQPTDPEGHTCQKSLRVIRRVISSSPSQATSLTSPGCSEQYDFPAQRQAGTPDSKGSEPGLGDASIRSSPGQEEPPGQLPLGLKDGFPAAQLAPSLQGHGFQHRQPPLAPIYHEPL